MWFWKKFIDDGAFSVSKRADQDLLEFANRHNFAPGALIVVFSKKTVMAGQEIVVMYHAPRELT